MYLDMLSLFRLKCRSGDGYAAQTAAEIGRALHTETDTCVGVVFGPVHWLPSVKNITIGHGLDVRRIAILFCLSHYCQ